MRICFIFQKIYCSVSSSHTKMSMQSLCSSFKSFLRGIYPAKPQLAESFHGCRYMLLNSLLGLQNRLELGAREGCLLLLLPIFLLYFFRSFFFFFLGWRKVPIYHLDFNFMKPFLFWSLSGLQLAYTVIFGSYASFLFVRTGG